jgi:hypothetical protein
MEETQPNHETGRIHDVVVTYNVLVGLWFSLGLFLCATVHPQPPSSGCIQVWLLLVVGLYTYTYIHIVLGLVGELQINACILGEPVVVHDTINSNWGGGQCQLV